MLSLADTLAHFKITITPDFSSDRIQREGPQWLRAFRFGVDIVYFGDYKHGVEEVWRGDDSALSPEEKREQKKKEREAMSEMKRARDEKQIEVKLECEKDWPHKIDRGTSDYLDRKQIPSLYGCKLDSNAYGFYLIVPARDVEGNLWNWQRVYNKKFPPNGDKFFLPGGKIEGLFHALTPIHPEGQIYLAEGFATAASIALALQNSATVISAFNGGNLLPVALALKAKYPLASFILCADDDAWTTKPDGRKWNPGQEYAHKAASAVGGIVLIPRFADGALRPTDWNDLHCLEGLALVKEQLTNPDPPASPTLPEKKPKISEKRIAEIVLEKWHGRLIRQDKSLFKYVGTHWIELESYEIDQLKNEINATCQDALGSKVVNAIYATLFRLVPHVPEKTNLFTPNPRCGNFLDGTLRLNLEPKTGTYCLSFSAHRPEDFLTWVIPVNYQCDRGQKNPLFDECLRGALEGEQDAAGITRALKQMGGSMLVPTFSQMFFLYGVSGSRKSTIALAMAKVIAPQNISACDPANMQNFEIEGMMGKLVNMHTDIDDHVALPRGFLKRFEDDVEVQVNRKGKPVVRARLPRIHVYCANELPPNFEGGKAFMRRLTLLKFKNDLTHRDTGQVLDAVKKHFENLIWEAGYEGILNFCLEGLEDLVNSGGKFFQPLSSLAGGKEWQLKRDYVGQFLEAAERGEIVDNNTKVMWGEKWRIKPAQLWLCFVEWHKIVLQVPPRMGRNAFYSRVLLSGITKVDIKGHEHFAGIGVTEVELCHL